MGVCIPLKVPMFPKTHKVWGWTQSFVITDRPTHSALAYIKSGGFSSKHYHKNNFNRFLVVTGCLEITIWRHGVEETLTLDPYELLDVEPEVWHRMKAWEDTNLIETYWAKDGFDLDVEDIIREDNGGVESVTPGTPCKVPYGWDFTQRGTISF